MRTRGRPRIWEDALAPAVAAPGEWVEVRSYQCGTDAGAAVRRLRHGDYVLPAGLWLFRRVGCAVQARWSDGPAR